MAEYENELLPFPVQNKLTKQIRQAAALQNNPEFMSLWAGQNAKKCEKIPVAKLIEKLMQST